MLDIFRQRARILAQLFYSIKYVVEALEEKKGIPMKAAIPLLGGLGVTWVFLLFITLGDYGPWWLSLVAGGIVSIIILVIDYTDRGAARLPSGSAGNK